MAGDNNCTDTAGTAERMLWLWSNLIGQVVTISCTDGLKWEGLMEGKSDDSFEVVLSSARLKSSSKKKQTEKTLLKQNVKISCSEIAYLQATEVQVTEHEVSGRQTKLTGDPSDREFVPWSIDNENTVALDPSMEGDCGTWDQFADPMNQFKSTYHEELYTTKLEKDKFSQTQIDNALRIADEIERKGGGRHDHATWADDYDEEAKHSCIPRASDEISQELYQKAQTSYIPPHLRGRPGAAPSASLAPPPVNPSNDATLTPQNRTGIQSHAEVEAAAKAAVGDYPQQYEKMGSLRYRKDDGPPTALPEDVYQEPAMDHQPPSAPVPQQEQEKPLPTTTALAAVSPAVPTSSLSIGGRRTIKQNGMTGLGRNRILDPTGRNIVIQKLSNGTSAVSREQEIAKLKEASSQIQEKLDKGKKKEEVKVKEDDSHDGEDGETPIKEAKKLNPNANPFKMPGGGEEAPDSVKEFTPAAEPTWKPTLSEKAKVESKFICKIIADGIYQKLRQSRPTQTGAVPIPGDSAPFHHEWHGDDYYWDEENEDLGSRGYGSQQQPQMSSQYHQPPQQHHQHPNPSMQHEHQGMPMQPRQQYFPPQQQQQQQYQHHPQQGMQPNPSWTQQQQQQQQPPQYQQQPQPTSQWNAPNTGYPQPNYGQQSHHMQQHHPQQMSQQQVPQQYPQGMQHGMQQRPFQGYQQQSHGAYQPQQQMQVGGMHQYNPQHQQEHGMMGGPPIQQQLPTSSHSQFQQPMPPRGAPNQQQPQYGQQMGVHDQVGMDPAMQQQYQPNQMHGHPPGQRRMVPPNMQNPPPRSMGR